MGVTTSLAARRQAKGSSKLWMKAVESGQDNIHAIIEGRALDVRLPHKLLKVEHTVTQSQAAVPTPHSLINACLLLLLLLEF